VATGTQEYTCETFFKGGSTANLKHLFGEGGVGKFYGGSKFNVTGPLLCSVKLVALLVKSVAMLVKSTAMLAKSKQQLSDMFPVLMHIMLWATIYCSCIIRTSVPVGHFEDAGPVYRTIYGWLT
jgi:hypothetical protein